jgi:asparagine synthase (glutamine-hydrolysing)
MINLVSHRGPDGSGINTFSVEKYRDPITVGLGHVRLSIVDLSENGHQPMSYMGRYWITYNGEIYNYIEIRRILQNKGYIFKSHTDTEVILASYAEWGDKCLEHFNGMFAFVLFDSDKNELFIARDRFGVKPLYYWSNSERQIAFASEIKQFSALKGWVPVLNGQRAYDYLNWSLTDHTAETLFESVYQLRPGQALKLSIEKVNQYLKAGVQLPVYDWYDLKPMEYEGSMEQAASSFFDLFRDSVSLRLNADVPVGSCLSGGLDSSSIVAMIDHLKKYQSKNMQKTFSACSYIDQFDERKWVDIVVNATDAHPYYTYPSFDNLFSQLEEITWHQDEPFGTSSVYAQWNVFHLAASNGVKVMLDGQGADELCAGYHSFFDLKLANLFTNLRWVSLMNEMAKIRRIHNKSHLYMVSTIGGVVLPKPINQFLRKALHMPNRNPSWLNMEALGASTIDPFESKNKKITSIRELSGALILRTNLQKLLHWEDRNSMAHSVEARLPFLDYRLVEAVLGMPDEFKIGGGVTKIVLREGMRKILPEKTRVRMDKMGFVTPERAWVCEHYPDLFKNKVKEVVEVHSRIFTNDTAKFVNNIIDGKYRFSNLPWRIINFGVWMKKFNVSCQ